MSISATPLKTTEQPTGFVRNSSIRMSDTRARRSMRDSKAPILPPSNEIRSSGLGSEDSFSETNSAALKNYSLEGKLKKSKYQSLFLTLVINQSILGFISCLSKP